jgi:inner membrane protein
VDSLTHVALGACLGEILGGRQLGKKALLLGAAAQNLPDIDVVCSLWMDPTSNLLAHRGFTHSFLFSVLVSALLAWLFQRYSKTECSYRFWSIFFGIQVVTHCIIDGFNNYGTGWFEPFSHFRVSFHTLYVADPFFLLPILVASLFLLTMKLSHSRKLKIAGIAIALSSLYCAYGVFNKLNVNAVVIEALKNQKIDHNRFFTTPTPFNTWLWFVVASNNEGHHVGYYSVFDRHDVVDLRFVPRREALLITMEDSDDVRRLKRFSQSYYTIDQHQDTAIFNDLRFGQIAGWYNNQSDFVFHYYLQPPLDNTLVIQRGRVSTWNKETFTALVRRIRGED